MSSRLGKPLTPAQRYIVDVATEVLPDGTWAFEEVVILMQRRAGKTVLVEPVTLHRCGQDHLASVWLTAQKRDNAVKRWRQVRDVIVTSPFRPLVTSKIGVMAEEVRWPATGSTFTPFAPDEDSMHGEDPDLVWVDELWSFSMDRRRQIQGGYEPAFSVKTGQEWKMSAAGNLRSEWLKHDRARGREAVEADARTGIAFFEWCVPERADGKLVQDLDDERLVELVLYNHPRTGYGLRPGFVATQLGKLGRSEFLRFYGGIDADTAGEVETVIPWTAYQAARTELEIPQGLSEVGFGFAVDELRREAAISVAWRRPDGVALTQLVDCRPGVRWLAPRLAELRARYAGCSMATRSVGPSRDTADAVTTDGAELLRISQADWPAACARLVDGISGVGKQPSVLHLDEAQLGAALQAATTKNISGGPVWASAEGEPITAVESHTAAVWAADHPREQAKPLPEFKVW